MPNKIHSKVQMRKMFALESRGELPKGKAEEMAHAEGHKRLSRLPERVRKFKGGLLRRAEADAFAAKSYQAKFSPEKSAEGYDREHKMEKQYARDVHDYDETFRHYYGPGEVSSEKRKQRFAHGGRVDGSGKVDGIHTSPLNCSHLAAGGVCRHGVRDHAKGDARPRNFAKGGGVPKALADGKDTESFGHYLRKRSKMRGKMYRKEF